MIDLDASLRAATGRLAEAGIEGPNREARILLMHAISADQTGLLRRRGGELTSEEGAAFQSMIDRRAGREPAATIIGHREFWSLDFLVTADTLIPRPDSETVIETALDYRRDRPPARILDLGTGTGCLLLAALSEFPDAWGLGVDLSPRAADVAQTNAARLGLAGRATIMVGRWTDALNGRFDLILSNPPYIPHGDIPGLMPEVEKFEPHLALDGGADGLDPYRLLFRDLPQRLMPGGLALFEFGIGQGPALTALAESVSLKVLDLRRDLAGQERVLAVSHL
ncbi:peptide chain release factor N(5)-glutamine methyltransferase [Acidisoma cellulosilytica]|uniref:Release factor glutamine methyltransferase n=1 Tax=Acidisoma cellulosilyticum TaxID=2802395 RepID=A0A964E427_9PROT|nr:peptide chain release factor N(5)-glutamine methyltransferase [Acidisoma cellulosilyticum]MCB8880847.1 peptide chain release factor N(5)-glutamine methyltransferase [Acidisoma cellulosilyticum]